MPRQTTDGMFGGEKSLQCWYNVNIVKTYNRVLSTVNGDRWMCHMVQMEFLWSMYILGEEKPIVEKIPTVCIGNSPHCPLKDGTMLWIFRSTTGVF